MLYLIDKNLLTKEILANKQKRTDICIIREVVDEAGMSVEEIEEAKKNKIRVAELSLIHLKKLQEIMNSFGANLKLINLFKNEGTADVAMVAFVLGEREKNGLFNLEYTILTNDNAVIDLAKAFEIHTTQILPSESTESR